MPIRRGLNARTQSGATALHPAVAHGRLTMTGMLLSHPHCALDATDAQNTAVHLATACKDVRILRLVLASAAGCHRPRDPQPRRMGGAHAAAFNGREVAARLLLDELT